LSFRTCILASSLIALLPFTAMAAPKAGSYLAGRQAAFENDFDASARYFTQSLISDPTNPYLLENATVAYVGLGDFARAAPVADIMAQSGISSQMAHTVLSVTAAKSDDWAQVFTLLERATLSSDDTLAFSFVRSAQDGLAEAYLLVAQALLRDGNDAYTLRYARAAAYLNPANTDAILLTADLLENMEQFADFRAALALNPTTTLAMPIGPLGV